MTAGPDRKLESEHVLGLLTLNDWERIALAPPQKAATSVTCDLHSPPGGFPNIRLCTVYLCKPCGASPQAVIIRAEEARPAFN
jgi:hypothetical protein